MIGNSILAMFKDTQWLNKKQRATQFGNNKNTPGGLGQYQTTTMEHVLGSPTDNDATLKDGNFYDEPAPTA